MSDTKVSSDRTSNQITEAVGQNRVGFCTGTMYTQYIQRTDLLTLYIKTTGREQIEHKYVHALPISSNKRPT